jgi:hypothetical protein
MTIAIDGSRQSRSLIDPPQSPTTSTGKSLPEKHPGALRESTSLAIDGSEVVAASDRQTAEKFLALWILRARPNDNPDAAAASAKRILSLPEGERDAALQKMGVPPAPQEPTLVIPEYQPAWLRNDNAQKLGVPPPRSTPALPASTNAAVADLYQSLIRGD